LSLHDTPSAPAITTAAHRPSTFLIEVPFALRDRRRNDDRSRGWHEGEATRLEEALLGAEHIVFDQVHRAPSPTGNLIDPVGRTLKETERRTIELTLAYCGGNRSRTARMLGISRNMLQRHLDAAANDTDVEGEGEEE
jgi:DNA-binding NtrC family response regulator